MDIYDRATEREEQDRDRAMQYRRPTGPVATGQCLACEHPLPAGQRWCDAECRDDWEAAQP